ncbi:MAG: dihydrolipoyl dehydrogenase [Hyphomicrobiaceae bacterium]
MSDLRCKLLVIGAGPGGYVCAIRAGQLGLDTVIVDADSLGGTCLNVGCIPSKALIHAAEEFHKLTSYADGSVLGISATAPTLELTKTVAWKDGIVERLTKGVGALLKKANVTVIQGAARLVDGKTIQVQGPEGEQRIRAEVIVIATGSAPVELPSLPFGPDVMSSTDALAMTKLPKHLAIVGAGYIGLEIGMACAKLGASVTVLEARETILPQYDAALTRPVAKRLRELDIEVHTGAKATGFSAGSLAIERADGSTDTLVADKVMVTVGRRPRTQGVGLEELSLTMDGAFVAIDERCQTSMRGVFAIGDVTGEPMLAHRAMAQGEMVAEIVAGQNRSWDRNCIPAICFTDPEVVSVGVSPTEANAAGFEVTTSEFPFQASGRAMTMERVDGFVRVVARADDGVILGIQAVGSDVAELAGEFALAIEMGARAEDIAATVHPHPTRSEAFHEACLKVLGHPLHM